MFRSKARIASEELKSRRQFSIRVIVLGIRIRRLGTHHGPHLLLQHIRDTLLSSLQKGRLHLYFQRKIFLNIIVSSSYESENKKIKQNSMAGQGSGGNVIAALCSFFIPGLGQLLQGRLLMAVFMFLAAGALWIILLGWIIHLWSILDAAKFKP